jgi:hypothetical protein
MSDADRDDGVGDLVRSIRAEQRAERRTTRTAALMVVVLAAAAATAAIKAGSFGAHARHAQAQASDTWVSYQAKVVQRRLAEMESRAASGDEAARAAREAVRLRGEEKDVETKAERLEAARDSAARHVPPLEISTLLLLIAIAVAAIGLMMRRSALWTASALLGAAGVFYLVYGLG